MQYRNCLFVSPLPHLSGEIVKHGGSIVCFDTLMTMCEEFTDLSMGVLESIEKMGGNYQYFVQKSKQTEMPKASNRGCKGCSYWGYSQIICFPAEKWQKIWKGSLLLVRQTKKQKKKTLIKEYGLQDRM